MKKKYKLENLDCANCAAKMEEQIRKIDGVEDAAVSFLTAKLMIQADEAVFEQVLAEAQKKISAIHADTKIVM